MGGVTVTVIQRQALRPGAQLCLEPPSAVCQESSAPYQVAVGAPEDLRQMAVLGWRPGVIPGRVEWVPVGASRAGVGEGSPRPLRSWRRVLPLFLSRTAARSFMQGLARDPGVGR